MKNLKLAFLVTALILVAGLIFFVLFSGLDSKSVNLYLPTAQYLQGNPLPRPNSVWSVMPSPGDIIVADEYNQICISLDLREVTGDSDISWAALNPETIMLVDGKRIDRNSITINSAEGSDYTVCTALSLEYGVHLVEVELNSALSIYSDETLFYYNWSFEILE
jgi:hypothetical protein